MRDSHLIPVIVVNEIKRLIMIFNQLLESNTTWCLYVTFDCRNGI